MVDPLYDPVMMNSLKSITQEGCKFRADVLGVLNVKYDVTLALSRGREYFGEVEISFDL